MQSYTQK